MARALGIVLLFFSLSALPARAQQSPCEAEFEVEVRQGSEDVQGSLVVSFKGMNGSTVFKLYDLNNGGKEFEEIIDYSGPSSGSVIFRNLNPSTYIIQVVGQNCRNTLGNLEGFSINNLQE